MTEQTKGMNLQWAECPTGIWAATLPDIPGYPLGGAFRCFTRRIHVLHPRGHKDVWYFTMSWLLKSGERIFLTNQDFGINQTTTPEATIRLINQLTVEDIAAKFKEKGFEPVAE